MSYVLYFNRERTSHSSIEWVGVARGDKKKFNRVGSAMGKILDLKLIVYRKRNLSIRMRKPTICIGESKSADQLRSDCEADQHLCFHYTDRTMPLLSKSKNFQPLAIFCASMGRFVSDLVRNTNCWFSHAQAQFFKVCFFCHQLLII